VCTGATYRCVPLPRYGWSNNWLRSTIELSVISCYGDHNTLDTLMNIAQQINRSLTEYSPRTSRRSIVHLCGTRMHQATCHVNMLYLAWRVGPSVEFDIAHLVFEREECQIGFKHGARVSGHSVGHGVVRV